MDETTQPAVAGPVDVPVRGLTANPRVTNYCIATDLSLAEASREIWKFSLWIRAQWREWSRERGIKDRWYSANSAEHTDFDYWLTRRVADGLATPND